MLKRNLIVIAIAIITLGLGITSAFGQAADWEIKPAVKNPKTSVKKSNSVKVRKPQQVQPGNSGGTISNQRTSNNSSRKPQLETSNGQSIFTNDTIDKNKLGNFEIQGISECQQQLDWVKAPRNTASGQAIGIRQHLPIKSKNLGDTGTHEVGHKQRKRRN